MATPATNRQTADNSILDLNARQTYLGNGYIASTGLVPGVLVETPLMLLSNPSSNSAGQPSGNPQMNLACFNNVRKLINDTPSVVATFKFYSNPVSPSGGTPITPVNLRPATANTSLMTATLSPTVAGVAQVQTVDTVASTAGSLNNTYFLLSSINPVGTQKNWYLWFNVNSTGTDPALAGKTGIQVALAAGTVTANNVAVAMRSALNALTSDFVATGSTNHVIITNVNTGPATIAVDGAQPTGFTFNNTTPGSSNYGTFLSVLCASYLQLESGVLIALDPGQSMLVTAQVTNTANVAVELGWYEI